MPPRPCAVSNLTDATCGLWGAEPKDQSQGVTDRPARRWRLHPDLTAAQAAVSKRAFEMRRWKSTFSFGLIRFAYSPLRFGNSTSWLRTSRGDTRRRRPRLRLSADAAADSIRAPAVAARTFRGPGSRRDPRRWSHSRGPAGGEGANFQGYRGLRRWSAEVQALELSMAWPQRIRRERDDSSRIEQGCLSPGSACAERKWLLGAHGDAGVDDEADVAQGRQVAEKLLHLGDVNACSRHDGAVSTLDRCHAIKRVSRPLLGIFQHLDYYVH